MTRILSWLLILLALPSLTGCGVLGAVYALSAADQIGPKVQVDGIVKGYPTHRSLEGVTVSAIDLRSGETKATAVTDSQGRFQMSVRVSWDRSPWLLQAIQSGPYTLAAPLWPTRQNVQCDVGPGTSILSLSMLQLVSGEPLADFRALAPSTRQPLLNTLAKLDSTRFGSSTRILDQAIANGASLESLGENGPHRMATLLSVEVEKKHYEAITLYSRASRYALIKSLLLLGIVQGLPGQLTGQSSVASGLYRSALAFDLPTLVQELGESHQLESSRPQGSLELKIGVNKLSLDPSTRELPGLLQSLRFYVSGQNLAEAVVGTVPRRFLRFDADSQAVTLVLPGVEAGPVTVEVEARDGNEQVFARDRGNGTLEVAARLSVPFDLALDSSGLNVDLGGFPAPTVE